MENRPQLIELLETDAQVLRQRLARVADAEDPGDFTSAVRHHAAAVEETLVGFAAHVLPNGFELRERYRKLTRDGLEPLLLRLDSGERGQPLLEELGRALDAFVLFVREELVPYVVATLEEAELREVARDYQALPA